MNNHIAIAGGGPIGLAFALAASRLRDVNVTLIERQTLALARLSGHLPASAGAKFDHRAYALSPGSRKLLESLGVWQRLTPSRIEAVRAMQVFADASGPDQPRAELDFTEGQPLAFIVEHSELVEALIAEVREHAELINVLDDTTIQGVKFASEFAHQPQASKIDLSNGTTINAALLIAADGANSPLRALAGIAAETKDYESDGVVANFNVEHHHGGIARQWFGEHAVLAYLPLPNQQISIVWSVSKARADALGQLDDAAFAEAVAAAGEHALGALALASPRARFPLKRIVAEQWVQQGFALMGDAAHAIHPLAGQGANLGLADVRTMANVLRNRSSLSGIGDLALLRQYERARREDALVMAGVTDNLRSLFLSDSPVAARLRRGGLNAVNRLSAVKSLMMSQAMK